MLYESPHHLPWEAISGPLVAAEDSLARFDERLRTSPIREGVTNRLDFDDACACLWLAGEFVTLEDLVLHDAARDIHAPTHELTRAHTVLRARRRIAQQNPGWALTPDGLAALRGTEGRGPSTDRETVLADSTSDDPEFADIDAVLARSTRALASVAIERDPFIFDPDWDEDARLADWQKILADATKYPPLLAAALAWDAWEMIQPLQHRPWLGPLLAAAILRVRAKTRVHLVCLYVGLRTVRPTHRRAPDQTTRLVAFLDACAAAAAAGLKEHDRLILARGQLQHRAARRRKTSRLPALIDLVLARPLVSTTLIADELAISARAAQNLVLELGLRELTGRGRYRAWAI
jgi:Protein of unknown function (DUF1612)/HTH DNA binding domain